MARNQDPAPLKQSTAALRRSLRKTLHGQLDAILNGMTDEDGVRMGVIDSMVLRALRGFGFNVRVHALHPNDPNLKAVSSAPGTVERGPALGLKR